jgi:hypothetical protein
VPTELEQIEDNMASLTRQRDQLVHAAQTIHAAYALGRGAEWCIAAHDEMALLTTEIGAISGELATLSSYKNDLVGMEPFRAAFALTPQQEYDQGNDRRGAILAQRAKAGKVA